MHQCIQLGDLVDIMASTICVGYMCGWVNVEPITSYTTSDLCRYFHSLGVIFLGITDTSDLGVEEIEISPSTPASQQQLQQSPDEEIARQLQLQQLDVQLERDAQFAEQLQMKENSYLTPRLVQTVVIAMVILVHDSQVSGGCSGCYGYTKYLSHR